MFRRRTGLVAVFAIVLGGLFAPSALATTPLTASKTATVNWTKRFDWTIDKSVTPASHSLMTGQSATSTYTVAVTKSAGVEAMTVAGQICVTNNGAVATEGLAITDRIVVFKANGNTQTLDRTDVNTSANPVLDPGESHCYGYSFPFAPFPDAVGYENRTSVTITNDPRSPGEPLGPTADAPFTVPSAPTLINDAVNVDDTNGMSWPFTSSGSKTYARTFMCDRDKGTHSNTATIRQTGQSDSAAVVVTCISKPVCPPKGDKDKDKHKGNGHKGYSGYGDRGRHYSQRGRDDHGDDNRCDHDDDSSDDSSDDSHDWDDSDDGDRGHCKHGWWN